MLGVREDGLPGEAPPAPAAPSGKNSERAPEDALPFRADSCPNRSKGPSDGPRSGQAGRLRLIPKNQKPPDITLSKSTASSVVEAFARSQSQMFFCWIWAARFARR